MSAVIVSIISRIDIDSDNLAIRAVIMTMVTASISNDANEKKKKSPSIGSQEFPEVLEMDDDRAIC